MCNPVATWDHGMGRAHQIGCHFTPPCLNLEAWSLCYAYFGPDRGKGVALSQSSLLGGGEGDQGSVTAASTTQPEMIIPDAVPLHMSLG